MLWNQSCFSFRGFEKSKLSWNFPTRHRGHSPAQLILGAVALQTQAVGLPRSFLPPHVLLVGTGRDDGFPAAFPAQRVGAGTEEQSEAVLFRHSLQETPQGFVTLLAVAVVLGAGGPLGAGDHVLRPQGAAFLVQTAVLGGFQTLVLTVDGKSGSWRREFNSVMFVREEKRTKKEGNEERFLHLP